MSPSNVNTIDEPLTVVFLLKSKLPFPVQGICVLLLIVVEEVELKAVGGLQESLVQKMISWLSQGTKT